MPWRNGRYVPRETTAPVQAAVSPAKIQGIARNAFRSTSLESENFNDDLFDSTLIGRVFTVGSFTA